MSILKTVDANSVGYGDKGNEPSPQGLVNIRTQYDGSEVKKRISQSMSLPVYGLPNQRTLDVCTGEILFTKKLDDSSNHYGETPVISSFNADGPDIEALYKNDEEQKISALLNRYKVVGVSQTFCSSGASEELPFLTCQVGGVVGFIATTKLPTGCYSMIRPVTPSTARSENRVTPQGSEPGKVVGELVPYDPKLIGVKMQQNMLNFLSDRVKYIKAMKAGLRSTDAWVTSLTTVCKFESLSFLMGLELFIKKGLFSVIVHNNELNQEALVDANARGHNTTNSIVTLSPGGLRAGFTTGAGATVAQVSNVLDSGGVYPHDLPLPDFLLKLAKSMSLLGPEILVDRSNISKSKENQWSNLVREFNLKCHYDGTIANLATLFDPRTNEILGKNSTTGKINTTRPEGSLLKLQLNLHQALYSALGQAIVTHHEWLGPKIIKGGLPKNKVTTLWA